MIKLSRLTTPQHTTFHPTLHHFACNRPTARSQRGLESPCLRASGFCMFPQVLREPSFAPRYRYVLDRLATWRWLWIPGSRAYWVNRGSSILIGAGLCRVGPRGDAERTAGDAYPPSSRALALSSISRYKCRRVGGSYSTRRVDLRPRVRMRART